MLFWPATTCAFSSLNARAYLAPQGSTSLQAMTSFNSAAVLCTVVLVVLLNRVGEHASPHQHRLAMKRADGLNFVSQLPSTAP